MPRFDTAWFTESIGATNYFATADVDASNEYVRSAYLPCKRPWLRGYQLKTLTSSLTSAGHHNVNSHVHSHHRPYVGVAYNRSATVGLVSGREVYIYDDERYADVPQGIIPCQGLIELAMEASGDLSRLPKAPLPFSGMALESGSKSSVYFIRAGNCVKVGKADDVAKRMAGLQTGNHMRLHLIATMPGAQKTETAIHREWAPNRLHGEWFSDITDEKVFRAIAAFKANGKRAKALESSQAPASP